jgi:hypothetical protein
MKLFAKFFPEPGVVAADNTAPSNSIFLDQLRERVRTLHQKNKWIVPGIGLGVIFLLLLLILWATSAQQNSVATLAAHENQQATRMLSQLSDINAQLQQMAANPQNSSAYKSALGTMSADLSAIQTGMSDLAKHADIEKVSSQLTSMQGDVDNQMLDLKKAVAGGLATKNYLDASVLPFRVVSIDVMSQQPFVSIDYDHHITPLAIGDTMAGWTVTAADYDAGSVEFKNARSQYVKQTVQG